MVDLGNVCVAGLGSWSMDWGSLVMWRRWSLRRLELAGVMEATRALASAGDLADGLALLARELTGLVGGSACMISRYDATRNGMVEWAGFVRPPGRLNRIAESYSLADYPATQAVMMEQCDVAVEVGSSAFEEEQALLVELGFRASLMLPLTHGTGSFGVVELFDRRRRRFSAAERRFARLVVDQAAIVLSAIRTAETLDRQDLAMVAALANALGAKDAYTRRHAGEIGDLAAAVGEHLGMRGSDLRLLRMGGLLHDIGKIGIPEAILNKPEALTDAEFDTIKQHTTIGANIIRDVPGLTAVTELVRSSHERWDGAGYPRGLHGEQIPLGARIVAVCDAFQAMTEDRVYRKAMSTELALTELARSSGTQFWPPAVTALDAVIRHGERAVRYPEPDPVSNTATPQRRTRR
jgi:putative nucleotidyltransferase with HDIG domain